MFRHHTVPVFLPDFSDLAEKVLLQADSVCVADTCAVARSCALGTSTSQNLTASCGKSSLKNVRIQVFLFFFIAIMFACGSCREFDFLLTK